jgi:protein-S-isoprenylcysteine O-methyltransferase Ste14
MSFIPEFELGLWNAWIFMLFVLFLNILPYLLWSNDKEKLKKLGWDMPLSKTDKKISNITSFLVLAPIAYGIFLPLKLETVWFYIGLIVYLAGAIIAILAMQKLVTAPGGKPVTTGVYHFSRNPGYLGLVMVFVGIGIACISWVFLLIAVVLIMLLHMSITSEERYCLQQYGDAYREYMNTIPRWIGIPRSK